MATNTTRLIIDVAGKGIRTVQSALVGLSRTMWGLTRWSFGKIFSLPALLGFGSAVGLVGATIKKAFDFETYRMQFGILFKSMEKAKVRFEELKKFSAETPFQLEGIAQASRLLSVFSENILGGEESLKLVGDAAASANREIQDVAFWFGRAYSMIIGGKPFGEAAMRLQEMGILSVKARQRMEALQKAGAKSSAVYAVLTEDFRRFSGGMQQLSQTGNGLFSTLKDNWTIALATFGDELAGLAKDTMRDLIAMFQRLSKDGTITKWAKGAADSIINLKNVIAGLFESKEKRIIAVEIIKKSLEAAAYSFLNILAKGASGIGSLIWKGFKSASTLSDESKAVLKPTLGGTDTALFKFFSSKFVSRAFSGGEKTEYEKAYEASKKEISDLLKSIAPEKKSNVSIQTSKEDEVYSRVFAYGKAQGFQLSGISNMFKSAMKQAAPFDWIKKYEEKLAGKQAGTAGIDSQKLGSKLQTLSVSDLFAMKYGTYEAQTSPELEEMQTQTELLTQIAANTGGGIE